MTINTGFPISIEHKVHRIQHHYHLHHILESQHLYIHNQSIQNYILNHQESLERQRELRYANRQHHSNNHAGDNLSITSTQSLPTLPVGYQSLSSGQQNNQNSDENLSVQLQENRDEQYKSLVNCDQHLNHQKVIKPSQNHHHHHHDGNSLASSYGSGSGGSSNCSSSIISSTSSSLTSIDSSTLSNVSNLSAWQQLSCNKNRRQHLCQDPITAVTTTTTTATNNNSNSTISSLPTLNANTSTTSTTNYKFTSAKQRSQIHFLLLSAFAYILSPIDLIPEMIFGVFGILDDILFLFLCLFCVAIILLYPIFREIQRTLLGKVGLIQKLDLHQGLLAFGAKKFVENGNKNT